MDERTARLHLVAMFGMGVPSQLVHPIMLNACNYIGVTPTSSPTGSPSASPGFPTCSVTPPLSALQRAPTASATSPPSHVAIKSFSIDAILGGRCSSATQHQRQHQQQQLRISMFNNDSDINCSMFDNPASMSPTTDVRLKHAKHITFGDLEHRTRRPKRIRTIFTSEQLDRMERAFSVQQYMVGKQRCHLAETLGLHENQVKVWFQNRRIKWRRQNMEMEQARLSLVSEPSHQRHPLSAGAEDAASSTLSES